MSSPLSARTKALVPEPPFRCKVCDELSKSLSSATSHGKRFHGFDNRVQVYKSLAHFPGDVDQAREEALCKGCNRGGLVLRSGRCNTCVRREGNVLIMAAKKNGQWAEQ